MAEATTRKPRRAATPADPVAAKPTRARAPRVDVPPAPARPLEAGARGPVVLGVQERLVALGVFDGKVDGLFGYATVRAVRRVQGAAGLRPSGVIDAATWAAIHGGGQR